MPAAKCVRPGSDIVPLEGFEMLLNWELPISQIAVQMIQKPPMQFVVLVKGPVLPVIAGNGVAIEKGFPFHASERPVLRPGCLYM